MHVSCCIVRVGYSKAEHQHRIAGVANGGSATPGTVGAIRARAGSCDSPHTDVSIVNTDKHVQHGAGEGRSGPSLVSHLLPFRDWLLREFSPRTQMVPSTDATATRSSAICRVP